MKYTKLNHIPDCELYIVAPNDSLYKKNETYMSDCKFHNVHHKEVPGPKGTITFHREWYDGFSVFDGIEDALFNCVNGNWLLYRVRILNASSIVKVTPPVPDHRNMYFISDSIEILSEPTAAKEYLTDVKYCIELLSKNPMRAGIVNCVSDDLYTNKEFAIYCVKRSPTCIKYFPNFYDDEDIFIIVINESPGSFSCCPVQFSERLKTSEEILLKILSSSLAASGFLMYPKNKESLALAKKVIIYNSRLYKSFSDEIKNNREIAILAVTKNWTLYDSLPEKFKNDVEICKIVISVSHSIYPDLPLEMRENEEIAKCIFSHDGTYVLYCDKWKNSKKMALIAIKSNPYSFGYFSKKIQFDSDIKNFYASEVRAKYR